MFDPNVSDPLVIEHGPESYGVIAPMELVVNAAIFHDIAHMRVGGGESKYGLLLLLLFIAFFFHSRIEL